MMSIRMNNKRAVLLVCTVCSIFLFITSDSFSRAGGGQSYSSKGSSYKSSSSSSSYSGKSYSGSSYKPSYSGSSSSSSKTYVPTYIPYSSGSSGSSTTGSGTTGTAGSTTTAPVQSASSGSDWIWGIVGLLIIIAVVALVVFLLIKLIRKIFGKDGGLKFDDTKPTEYNYNPEIIKSIMAQDPDFSPELFMEKAKTIIERLQDAWSKNDMIAVRNYVSQGVYNRFKLQLELMIEEEKVRNILSDFKVLKISMMDLSTSANYQTLHVSIFACSKDATVGADASDEDMRKALDKAVKSAFYEVYSFTRKLGSKTNTKNNWLKGQCPNCGYVPDNFSETNKCSSCGSIYNSGEFDWVLSEITQQEEWQAGSAEDIDGLADLEGKNLSINREVIEDRASYLFWRWLYSRIKGTSAPLARDASPEMLDSIPVSKEPLYNTAVGSVDLISVETDNSDATADVKIQWSTAMIKGQEPYHQEHNFILKMPLVQKNPYGLADHSCNSCGGPLPETDALKCSYCGSELPATVTDWQLVSVEQVDWESEYVPEDEE